MIKRVLAEGIGTFFFAFAIGTCNNEPFAVGATLWASMIFTGFASGAHFNPAVTLTLILHRLFAKSLTKAILTEYVLYILIQICFALIGAFLASSIVKYVSYFDIEEGYTIAGGFFSEMIFAVILSTDVIMVSQLTNSNLIAGSVITMSITAGNWAIGKISGACFNPAIGLSINIVNYIVTGTHFSHTWIYILAPFIGACIGSVLGYVFTEEIKEQKIIKEDKFN